MISGSGVMNVEFGYENSGVITWFDGGLLNGTTVADGYWNASFDTLGLSGYYNVSVRSTDFAGNTKEHLKFAEIFIDNVEPRPFAYIPPCR